MTKSLLRRYGIFVHDLVMATLAIYLAFYLRLGPDVYTYATSFYVLHFGLFTGIAGMMIYTQGLYKSVWSYTSFADVMTIIRVTTYTVLAYGIALFLVTRLNGFPRSSLMIAWLVLGTLLGGPRILFRLMKDKNVRQLLVDTKRQVPVLLVGASDGTEVFIRETARMANAPYRAIGIIDDKGTRIGRKIRGVEAIGHLDNLEEVLTKLKTKGSQFPQRLVITKREIDGADVRRLVTIAEKFGLQVSRLPDLTDFSKTASEKMEPRPIAIEDLLGRPQAVLDRPGMEAMIKGRRVLVTGAGGTIGGELCRQIAGFAPASLTLLDISEFHLYEINLELSENFADVKRDQILADVRDKDRMDRIFATVKPDIVCHAAALKHVPIVESHPMEGVLTNIIGTQNVADCCVEYGVKNMVMISTDKAVNPTSIMGMTKRVAEIYCQALDAAQDTTRFVTVRFGNVLGSTGSVVPLFQRQIARGGPITVTDPAMTRYFMSTKEAVELILQAAVVAQNSEQTIDKGRPKSMGKAGAGQLFVLDMGEPVKIVDLARQMIILTGLKPEKDIQITFTGARKGEKIAEELFHGHEDLMETDYTQIFLATPAFADYKTMKAHCAKLEKLATKQQEEKALELLGTLTLDDEPARKRA